MKLFIPKILWLLLAVFVAPSLAFAQDFDFRPPASALDPALPAAMRDLAQRVLPVYQENDQDRYLSNLSVLQMVAGDPVSAYATRQSLQERRRNANSGRPASRELVYDIYVRARAIEAQVRTPFGNAYAQAFRDAVNRIDDMDAHVLERQLTTPSQPLQEGLQRSLDQRRGKTSIALNEALDLVWAWFAFEAYRSFSAVVRPLVAAEDKRRYVTEEDVTIPVSKTGLVTATVVRPRIVAGKLPAILEFTLDTETRDPLEAAAHGYVSVLARARGLRDKTDPLPPFQTEGDDARAVIEWMAKQAWSNGRVGLLGTNYGGYVAWAAAKRVPPALKVIVTSDPMAPGIDLPMSGGGIFVNPSYRWLYSVTAAPDDKLAGDDARWRALDEDWYKNGRRYREFPTLPGRASTIFRGWLNHPSYGRYWQKMLPFREEFGRINIPVLTVTGYYSSGAAASLYYFTQHHQHNAHANHALLIGPYDDQSVERGPATSLRGLPLDTAAVVEIHDAWYEWFDHALKGGKRPPLLSASVNYQLAGTNEWRHTAAVDAPDSKSLRFYLIESASPNSDLNRLAEERAEKRAYLPQTFDLQDRSDIGFRPPRELVQRTLKARDGELFVSEPLKQTVDVAGLLRGQLDFTVNKVDMDLVVSLYELRPNGDYVKLFDPAYAFRASYARDRGKRRLLHAGERQQLSFRSERMMARRLQAGSRLIMALGINKRADQQLNYGTGDDVSEESIEDAGVPVRIRWYNSSFVEIPTQ
jgi:putative CocE/NonD family hydrolase